MDSRSGGRTVPKGTTTDRDTLNLHGYCAQVLSALVSFALDQPQAQPFSERDAGVQDDERLVT
jgi:hypothetical protein